MTEAGITDNHSDPDGSVLTAPRLPRPAVDSGFGSRSAFDIVFPIRTEGAGAPVFCIHPIVGLSWCYLGFEEFTVNPLYGIQTPSQNELPDTLDELAQRYIDEIEALVPDGRYHLLGWSLGGTIAHAMAVRVRAQGKQLGSLVMLDSHAVAPENVCGTEGSTAAILPSLIAESGVVDPREVERLVSSARHTHELAKRHSPGVYDGDVLFVTADREERLGLSTWHPYLRGDLSHYSIPSSHWQMTSASALRAVGPLAARYIGAHAG